LSNARFPPPVREGGDGMDAIPPKQCRLAAGVLSPVPPAVHPHAGHGPFPTVERDLIP